MTYCIAWKNEKTVGIVTDSAVTSNSQPYSKLSDFTSFGEKHLYSSDRNTEERALKIFNVNDNLAITIIGNAVEGRKFIIELNETIKNDISTWDAVNSVAKKFAPIMGYELVFSFVDKGYSRLFRLNSEGIFEINDGEILQLGSVLGIDGFPKEAVQEFIKDLSSMSPQEQHTLTLSYCQSLGQLNNWIKYGVGGIFYGIYFSDGKINWNSDILYVLREDDDKDSKSRLVSLTSVSNAIGCFNMTNRSGDDSRKRLILLNNFNLDYSYGERDWDLVKLVKNKLSFLSKNPRYDYIVFIGLNNPTLLCIEMKKKCKHKLLEIESIDYGDKVDTKLTMNKKIIEFHKLPNAFDFIKFF